MHGVGQGHVAAEPRAAHGVAEDAESQRDRDAGEPGPQDAGEPRAARARRGGGATRSPRAKPRSTAWPTNSTASVDSARATAAAASTIVRPPQAPPGAACPTTSGASASACRNT